MNIHDPSVQLTLKWIIFFLLKKIMMRAYKPLITRKIKKKNLVLPLSNNFGI